MGKGLDYFIYEFPGWSFIGENPNQIIDTLKYYKDVRAKNSKQEQEMYSKLVIPSKKKIKIIREDLNFEIYLPFGYKDQFIDAQILPNVVFSINANAVKYVKIIGENWKKYKRGDLYKFIPGISSRGIWFLPESIMKGLNEYDWSQHKQQINLWLKEREKGLNDIESKGHLKRPFKNISN